MLFYSGVACEKILVMPLGVCPKLTRRHYDWRQGKKFFKFIGPLDLVRALNGQKYMFTYHIDGQFRFMFILYL